MIKKTKIDEEICNEMQALAYDFEGRDYTVQRLIERGIDITSPQFVAYDKEKEKAYIKMKEAESLFEKEFIKDNLKYEGKDINWSLNYYDKELTIEIKDSIIGGCKSCQNA